MPRIPKAAEAVAMAMSSSAWPVSLFELGDNVGGGQRGDAAVVLEELLRQKAERLGGNTVRPESVQQCVAAGIGGQVTVRTGGKLDKQHGPTLTISGRVRTLQRRHLRRPNGGTGAHAGDRGLSAVVEVNRTGAGKGGLLILNSQGVAP